MKLLLKIIGARAMLALLAILVAFLLPRKYRIERSAQINARPEVVFAQIGDLKAWKNWTVWHERDPAMKLSYSATTTGVGAWSAWESKTEGDGKMTFTASEPPRRLTYNLEFLDMAMVSTGAMELEPAGDGVRVTWVSEGDHGMSPVNRWFGFLMLDKMVGADFEKGLAKLKTVTEAAK